MPELPEVETVCKGLAPILEGRCFVDIEVRRTGLRRPFPRNLKERLLGRTVRQVRRRAKYFLWDLDDGMSVLGHLGMSGRIGFHTDAPPVGLHDHLRFQMEGGSWVVFTDPRRFGLFLLSPTKDLDRHPLLASLGPEPLSDSFNAIALQESLKGRKSAIKLGLLDQKVVAGLGNIYACEALFRSRISPERSGGTLTLSEARRLVREIRAVLREAIASGGSSLRDHRQADGTLGYFQHAFAVYGREGKACPGCECDVASTGGVQRLTQGGRSTFFCSVRQR